MSPTCDASAHGQGLTIVSTFQLHLEHFFAVMRDELGGFSVTEQGQNAERNTAAVEMCSGVRGVGPCAWRVSRLYEHTVGTAVGLFNVGVRDQAGSRTFTPPCNRAWLQRLKL